MHVMLSPLRRLRSTVPTSLEVTKSPESLKLRYSLKRPCSTTNALVCLGMNQASIVTLLIFHPRVSTCLAVQVNSTVVFAQTALPESTSTALVRVRDRLGVSAVIKLMSRINFNNSTDLQHATPTYLEESLALK